MSLMSTIRRWWAEAQAEAKKIEDREDRWLAAARCGVVEGSLQALLAIESSLARCREPGVTWEEIQMELADIITAATSQITTNTSQIAAALTAAVSDAAATNKTLSDKLSAAETASAGLAAAVKAQTDALNPPAPAQPAPADPAAPVAGEPAATTTGTAQPTG